MRGARYHATDQNLKSGRQVLRDRRAGSLLADRSRPVRRGMAFSSQRLLFVATVLARTKDALPPHRDSSEHDR